MSSLIRTQKTDRLPGLDLLRLFAALAVVAFHWLYRGSVDGGYITVRYEAAAPLAEFGYLGVNLFFLISGYVISRTAEGRGTGDFFVARAARLYPGHVACMSLTFLVLLAAAHPSMPVSAAQWLANLTMVAPAFGQPFMDGVYWSIVLELVFYGWVALAIALGLFDRHAPRIVVGWLALAAFNEFWLQSPALRILAITEYAPLFAFGMMARHWRERERHPAIALVAVAAFLLSCTTLDVTRQWMLEAYGQAPAYPALLVANGVIHVLFLAALTLGNRLGNVGLWSVTYAIYLLHQYIGYVIIERAEPFIGKWPAAALAAAVIAGLSVLVWLLVERPGNRLIKRLGGLALAHVPGPAGLRRKSA